MRSYAREVRTSLPLLLVWTSPDDFIFSPTQITTHIECERKWAWNKIAKIEAPPNKAAELGVRTHTVLERYLGDGEMPDFVRDAKAASVASSGLHLLPEPKTEGMLLEQHFRFKSARTGFVYHGFKDVQIRPGVPVPSLGFDGSAPIVLDHKTTKRVGKYPKDLQYDAQATLYALDSMARFASDAADLGWVYYQTEGKAYAAPELARLEATHALRVFDAIEKVAESAANALSTGKQPLDLPPNPAACRSYGGCPYQHLCNLSPSQRMKAKMSSSIIASLKKRVQGSDAPATQATEAPAPQAAQATDAPVAINPPESALPPAPVEAKVEEKPKAKREPKKPKTEKDPLGSDALAHTLAVTPSVTTESIAKAIEAEAHEPKACATVQVVVDPALQVTVDTLKRALDASDAAHAPEGFTLYVDCLPIGRKAKNASSLIATAQEVVEKETGMPDYRMVDYGKGAPLFIAAVIDQLDGTDLTLDTRTPEGAVLLETLSAKASLVVRGLR